MNKNCTLSFLARLRQRMFRLLVDWEIFHRLFPHLEREAVHSYPFATDEEMTARTEELDLRSLLDLLDQQSAELPKAYGQSLRYIMHRDLHERLTRYARLTQRRIPHRSRHPRLAAECV